VIVRRLAIAALLGATIGLLAAAATTAGTTAGPRLSFVEWRLQRPMVLRLATVTPDGAERQVLTDRSIQPVPFAGASWSPDGATLAFAGYPPGSGSEGGSKAEPRIYLIGLDGGPPREVPGTVGASGPVFAPDGASIAFTRSKLIQKLDPKRPWLSRSYFSATAWTVAVAGGGVPRRLTRWRNGLLNEPASFSPDGKLLLLDRTRTPFVPAEVIGLDLSAGTTRVVARNAEEPTFSPDGTRIALVSYRDHLRVQTADGPVPVGELYVVRASGSNARRLTRTPQVQESDPSWDPSGDRLAFVSGGSGLGSGSSVVQVNADGSCGRRVLGPHGRPAFDSPALYGPSWQPGPGREAGPIPC
jgi:Tol biopolymer transport system component